MSLPKIAIIRISDAQKVPLPLYGNPVGTSMTLLSANSEAIKIAPNHSAVIETGLAIALPIGLEAQVRSLKQSTKTGVFVLNAPATIDAADREEIKVCLYNASNESVLIKERDPIALLVFSPALRVEWDDMTFKNMPHIKQTETIISQTIENIVENQEQTENITEDQNNIEEFEPILQDETNNEKPLIEEKEDTSESSESNESITQPAQSSDTEQQPIQDENIKQQIQPENIAQSTFSNDDTLQKQDNVQQEEENETPVVKPPAFITEREEAENNTNGGQKFSGEKNEN